MENGLGELLNSRAKEKVDQSFCVPFHRLRSNFDGKVRRAAKYCVENLTIDRQKTLFNVFSKEMTAKIQPHNFRDSFAISVFL